jgi:hypothetical protein
LDKHGEFEKLKFPAFHKELLSQSYWNPGDDLGRVKVVIAEGFTRDHLTYPFERVKNIISFSFQHAPLDVLEASSIAWPNASMWRHFSLIGPYFAQAASPRGEGIIEHGHSPRHPATMPSTFPAPKTGSMPPPARQYTYDPFTEPVHAAFRGWRQASTDLSMPDCPDPSTRSNSKYITFVLQIWERSSPECSASSNIAHFPRRFGSLELVANSRLSQAEMLATLCRSLRLWIANMSLCLPTMNFAKL